MKKPHPQSITHDELELRLKQACDRAYARDCRLWTKIGISKQPKDNFTVKRLFPWYRPKSCMFKGSNWSFDPYSLYAESYDWWPMLMIIKGKLVRNDFPYSVTTAGHQRKLSKVLSALGIEPDVTISVKCNMSSETSVKEHLLFSWATDELRARKARVYKANRYQDQIDSAARLFGITKADRMEALKEAERERESERQRKRETDRIRQRIESHRAIVESREPAPEAYAELTKGVRNFTLILGGKL